MSDSVAAHRAQMPAGTERFLDARTLAGAHRRLAELLRPGLDVLDVGCGSGAITEGIARAVAPGGAVVGIDVSGELISLARERCARQPNLSFERTGVAALAGWERRFDVVTSARMLQWLADPGAALAAMVGVTAPGGTVEVLDYDHERTRWEPEPPASVLGFLEAFLKWRAEAGMDNRMSERLPALMEGQGLRDVRSTPQPEVARRGEADFDVRIALWGQVIATRGHQIVADGFLSEERRGRAQADFDAWAAADAQTQTLWLAAVEGTVPGG
jgi:SAM-dependent methyltransferase